MLVHLVFIELSVGRFLNVADNADGNRKVAVHAGEHHVNASIFGGFIMDHDVIHGNAVFTNRHCFEAAAVETDTFVSVFAENHWFAVFQDDGLVVADGAVSDGSVRLVVEDHTVLKYFYHAGAVVLSGAGHDVGGKDRNAVQCTSKECALCTHYQFTRIERIVDGAVRRSLGDLTELGSRTVLTFGKTVDFVVEDEGNGKDCVSGC